MAARKSPAEGRKGDKVWRDALMRAVRRADSGVKDKRLERMADKVVKLALDGDMQAVKEIGDRLDGKPAQSHTVSGDPEAPLVPVLNITLGKADGS